ncbi:hypothetical protein RRG08_035855 [Elysia crispata]|uniref:Uncharacterized protein n=1 Tax=Elysia crispata TaxID=231223 RepID=A0AAE0Z5L5_9GAST|nr:hypothetical protein RRG08_035855 [Elysia crispata]
MLEVFCDTTRVYTSQVRLKKDMTEVTPPPHARQISDAESCQRLENTRLVEVISRKQQVLKPRNRKHREASF